MEEKDLVSMTHHLPRHDSPMAVVVRLRVQSQTTTFRFLRLQTQCCFGHGRPERALSVVDVEVLHASSHVRGLVRPHSLGLQCLDLLPLSFVLLVVQFGRGSAPSPFLQLVQFKGLATSHR